MAATGLAEGTPTPASVILAAFDTARWPDTLRAIRSGQAQTQPPHELILVIDDNPGLLAFARQELPEVRVIPNTHTRGASGARNTGVEASTGDVVAFLDDDAVADPGWLKNLVDALDHPGVVGVGGRLVPLWPKATPRWFPAEFFWVVGASYRGMPEVTAPVRNVWAGSMALRRGDFDSVAGFREGFGKIGNTSRPEDTDLCIRVAAAAPGKTWVYVPSSLAGHKVPPARTRRRFFLSRCWQEGRGKAALVDTEGSVAISTERAYARSIVTRGIRDGVRSGTLDGLLRSGAIVTGLTAAIAGMATEKLALASANSRWRGLRRGGSRARSR